MIDFGDGRQAMGVNNNNLSADRIVPFHVDDLVLVDLREFARRRVVDFGVRRRVHEAVQVFFAGVGQFFLEVVVGKVRDGGVDPVRLHLD